MAAYVDHEFAKGFLLDEERLRKLNSIIRDRLVAAQEVAGPQFKVFRGDAFSYETADIEAVLAEDNSDWRRISRLDLTHISDTLTFNLRFAADHGTSLQIEGADRDQVFLLFSDVRQYLEEEVNLARLITRDHRTLIAMLVMMFAMAGAFLSTLIVLRASNASAAVFERTLSSSDVQEKLNFLINRQKARDESAWNLVFPALFLVLMPIALSKIPIKLTTYLFPSNVFLFGTQRARYERRRRIVGNIIWVGVVGFVVSVIAGIVVWWMTLKR